MHQDELKEKAYCLPVHSNTIHKTPSHNEYKTSLLKICRLSNGLHVLEKLVATRGQSPVAYHIKSSWTDPGGDIWAVRGRTQ